MNDEINERNASILESSLPTVRLPRSRSRSQLDFLGVQQSPDVEATWSASPFSWQLWPSDVDDDAAAGAGAASSLTSPKLWA